MTKYNIDELSLDEKIGQLLVFGFDGLKLNSHAINLITKYKFGNVILFAKNIKSSEQLFNLNRNLQKLALENIGIPLLITIDQEGGMVTRIKNGGTFFPGAMTITASNNSEFAYLSGKYMGEELLAYGINMNLAPSLDVNNNSLNPVIGVRSFSDNPKIVSDYGTKFIAGLQENVIATAKHFPGHGDTQVDSHLALPLIDYDRERLDNIELYPFKNAIKDGVKAIMASHINFPAYTENNLPTTLSKKCLTGLLREKLKFEGLIITDCMEMKAIQDNYTTEKGALMAVEAGANLVCLSHSLKLQMRSFNTIKEAVLLGVLSEETLNMRVSKVLEYKEEIDVTYFKKEFKELKQVIGNIKTRDFAYKVVKSAVTLVKGKPFKKMDNTLLIAVKPTITTIVDEESGSYDIITTAKSELNGFTTLEISAKPNTETIKKASKLAKDYEQIIICTYNANIYNSQLKLIKELLQLDLDLNVIAMRNPYDILAVDNIENFVCFYEYTPNSIKALMEYLKEKLILTGKVPIAYE